MKEEISIEKIREYLFSNLVPKWSTDIIDSRNGGYYERLNRDYSPIKQGFKRLHGQARNVYFFSHANLLGQDTLSLAKRGFDFLFKYEDSDTGGLYFKLDDFGRELDKTRDLYGMSFVILSCAFYYSVTQDNHALDLAKRTLDSIKNDFSLDRGYATTLDENMNKDTSGIKQNPHMHLLEACLFMYEVSDDEEYIEMADELVSLFFDFFLVDGTLREYFDMDLDLDEKKGNIVEGGHQYEWAWLLLMYEHYSEDGRLLKTAKKLVSWADEYAWDKKYEGIYDEINSDCVPIKKTKRIWALMECMKVHAVLYNGTGEEYHYNRLQECLNLFFDKYVDENILWREHLDEQLNVIVDYYPNTTPYHIFMALSEVLGVLEMKNKNKNL